MEFNHLVFHVETEAPAAKVGAKFPPAIKHEIKALGILLFEEDQVRRKVYRGSSKKIVQSFFRFLAKRQPTLPTLVSYNGSFFGLPVLVYHALQYGVESSALFSHYMTPSSEHLDLASEMSLYGAAIPVSMEDAGKLIGFPGRFGTPTNRLVEVDLLLMASIWLRLMLVSEKLSHDRYREKVKQVLRHFDNIPGAKKYADRIDTDVLLVK